MPKLEKVYNEQPAWFIYNIQPLMEWSQVTGGWTTIIPLGLFTEMSWVGCHLGRGLIDKNMFSN